MSNRTTKSFLGIDVSKPYFDASLMKVIDHEKTDVETVRFDNSVEGIKIFDKWLRKQKVSFDENTHTLVRGSRTISSKIPHPGWWLTNKRVGKILSSLGSWLTNHLKLKGLGRIWIKCF